MRTVYTTEQYRSIFSIGNEIFDVHDNERLSDDYLKRALLQFEGEQVKNFLSHQSKESKFPLLFYCTILYPFTKRNFISDDSIRKTINEWLNANAKSTISNLKFAFETCIKIPETTKSTNAMFVERTDEFVKYMEADSKAEYIKLAIEVLEESISLHRLKCDESTCRYETAYTFKHNYLNHLRKEYPMDTQEKVLSLTKLQWKGTQKELAELFVQLKRHGWIEKYEYKTIKTCFTNSNTIQQLLKPNTNTKTGEDEYLEVFTRQYTPLFHGIKQNPKN